MKCYETKEMFAALIFYVMDVIIHIRTYMCVCAYVYVHAHFKERTVLIVHM